MIELARTFQSRKKKVDSFYESTTFVSTADSWTLFLIEEKPKGKNSGKNITFPANISLINGNHATFKQNICLFITFMIDLNFGFQFC